MVKFTALLVAAAAVSACATGALAAPSQGSGSEVAARSSKHVYNCEECVLGGYVSRERKVQGALHCMAQLAHRYLDPSDGEFEYIVGKDIETHERSNDNISVFGRVKLSHATFKKGLDARGGYTKNSYNCEGHDGDQASINCLQCTKAHDDDDDDDDH